MEEKMNFEEIATQFSAMEAEGVARVLLGVQEEEFLPLCRAMERDKLGEVLVLLPTDKQRLLLKELFDEELEEVLEDVSVEDKVEIIEDMPEELALRIAEEEEIVKLSQVKAAEIIANAQTKSREMRKAAQDFVDDIMRRADEGLTANLGEVRKTRAALKQQVPTTKEQ